MIASLQAGLENVSFASDWASHLNSIGMSWGATRGNTLPHNGSDESVKNQPWKPVESPRSLLSELL